MIFLLPLGHLPGAPSTILNSCSSLNRPSATALRDRVVWELNPAAARISLCTQFSCRCFVVLEGNMRQWHSQLDLFPMNDSSTSLTLVGLDLQTTSSVPQQLDPWRVSQIAERLCSCRCPFLAPPA